MPFEDALNTMVSIGRLTEKQDENTGYLVTIWETIGEAKAYVRTLRGLERAGADTNQVFATHRIYMPLVDLEGKPMELDETMEAVEAVPFDYEEQKDLPRYKFKIVNKPHGHHYEVDALRIGPGGS